MCEKDMPNYFKEDKFIYHEDNIKIANCICELCTHYNNGKGSDECPLIY